MFQSTSRLALCLAVLLPLAASAVACTVPTSSAPASAEQVAEEDAGPSNDEARPRSAADAGTALVDETPAPDGGAETDAGAELDAGAPDAADAAPKNPPKPPPSACKVANQCMTASSAGSIAGDIGSDSITEQGSTSKWITFRVREDSRFGGSTRFTATLLSPPGTNYDLAVYVNTEADEVECTKESASSSLPAGSTDKVNMSWGYAFYDDSRTVRVEVKHVSGPCDTLAPWTLFVEGAR